MLKQIWGYLSAKDIREYYRRKDEFEGEEEIIPEGITGIKELLDEVEEFCIKGGDYILRGGSIVWGAGGVKLMIDTILYRKPDLSGVVCLLAGVVFGYMSIKRIGGERKSLEERIKIANKKKEKVNSLFDK